MSNVVEIVVRLAAFILPAVSGVVRPEGGGYWMKVESGYCHEEDG